MLIAGQIIFSYVLAKFRSAAVTDCEHVSVIDALPIMSDAARVMLRNDMLDGRMVLLLPYPSHAVGAKSSLLRNESLARRVFCVM